MTVDAVYSFLLGVMVALAVTWFHDVFRLWLQACAAKKLTEEERKGVDQWKALIDEHDAIETVLVMAQRRDAPGFGYEPPMWQHHDALERRIISVSAQLPHEIVEKLKAGEL